MTDHKELCARLYSFAETHGVGLTATAADLIEQQAARIAELESSVEFSQRRLDQLSKLQSNMQEPERTIVCDILANGFLLNPPIPADRYKAKQKAKRLVWDESDPVYRVAQSACGEWLVFKTVDDTWRAQRRVILSFYIPIDGPHSTESEARAACQAEFDRIYVEMTE